MCIVYGPSDQIKRCFESLRVVLLLFVNKRIFILKDRKFVRFIKREYMSGIQYDKDLGVIKKPGCKYSNIFTDNVKYKLDRAVIN